MLIVSKLFISYRKIAFCATVTTLFLLITTIKVSAIGRGCYVGGVLYTLNTDNGNRFFYRSPGQLTSACGFNDIGTREGNCRLYDGGNIYNNSSYTVYYDAFDNGWEEINCPLDNYVWMLISSIIGLSIFKFSRFKY